jgi:hypothetical protein
MSKNRIMMMTVMVFFSFCLVLTIQAYAADALPHTNTCTPAKLKAGGLAAEGCKALDEFMATFNSKDAMAWAKTLHYPHVRIAGGQVKVWNTPEEYAKDNDLSKLADAAGWGYSKWDWRQLVQQSPDKLHYTVQFTRYSPQGKKIASYESFYILTKVDGKWGTIFRSSYAGVAVPGAAY